MKMHIFDHYYADHNDNIIVHFYKILDRDRRIILVWKANRCPINRYNKICKKSFCIFRVY